MNTIWKTTATTCLVFILICTCAGKCPQNCKCEQFTVHCQYPKIPVALPNGTREVFLDDYQLTTDVKHFADPSWETVNRLDIILHQTDTSFSVPEGIFNGLNKLDILGLHGINSQNTEQRVTFFKGTFQGLDSLKHLDLSGNPSLVVDDLIPALSNKDVIPALDILNISEMQRLQNRPIKLYRFTTECLAHRHLRELYMDSMNIEFILDGIDDLCRTLEVFCVRNADLNIFIGDSSLNYVCNSLKVIDFTNTSNPALKSYLTLPLNQVKDPEKLFNMIYSILFSVETAILDNIIQSDSKPISFTNGNSYECKDFKFRLKNLSFRQNYVQHLNASFQNLNFQQGSEIDLSSNVIEYIHPKCVDPGNMIFKINLSNNRLHRMEVNYFDDFRTFLHNYPNVEDIDLSFNSIERIPTQMFLKSEKLRKLNLRSNFVKVIDLNPVEFVSLIVLDVRNNSLNYIDYRSRQTIQSLSKNKSVTEFAVYLGQNPYTCKCDGFSFETWVNETQFLQGDAYTCFLNNEKFDMKGLGITGMQHICDQQRIQRICLALAGTFALFIGVSVVVVCLVRRHIRKQDNVNKILNELKQADANECFLVFLSYCSEDAELVNRHIYHQLNNEISKIVGKKGTYVCIDEKHFRPGFPVIAEIITNLQKSYIVVCLISQAYCEKTWCQMEVEEAYNLHKPIILLIKDHVEQENLSKILLRLLQRNIIAKVTSGENGTVQFNPSIEVLCSSVLELAVSFSVNSRQFSLNPSVLRN